jgi:uncharacterized protein (DUF433 family)
MDLLSRITMDPLVMSGRPTIRKMRFTVVQMLELLAAGMSTEEILEDYPYLGEGGCVGLPSVCC